MRGRTVVLTLVAALAAGAVAHFGVGLLAQEGSALLGWTPSLAFSSGGSTTSVTTAAPSPATTSGVTASATSNSTSNNWTGYVDANGPYKGVSATWTVPKVQGNAGSGSVAEWVGLGGTGNGPDLIQAGVIETYARGQLQVQAFTENLPAVATSGRAIAPGTKVTASVVPGSTDTWVLEVKAGSTTLARQTVTLQPAQIQAVEQSADWIVEAPSTENGRIMPLASFGSVTFTNATAETASGRTLNMKAAGPPSSVILADDYGTLAQPGAVSASGMSFEVDQTSQSVSQNGGYGGSGGYGGYGGGYGYDYGVGGDGGSGGGYGYGGGGYGGGWWQ